MNAPFFKAYEVDPGEELVALAEKLEPRLRASFLALTRYVRDRWTVDLIRNLIVSGQIDRVMDIVALAGNVFANDVNRAVIAGADHAATFLRSDVGIVVNFNGVNIRAVRLMQENQLRLIREITEAQRDAIRAALFSGMIAGTNPVSQARAVRAAIGLTAYQVQIVANYRRNLENLERDALTRELRDRRSDRSVQLAIDMGSPLNAKRINALVERYAERWRNYRADVIASTESLRAVHQGAEEMFEQTIDTGALPRENIVRQWHTARDKRVRDTHGAMEGQQRPLGRAFTSGGGVPLRYPGDPNAPAEETVRCRCSVTTRVRRPSASAF